jgi:hypothetical protein
VVFAVGPALSSQSRPTATAALPCGISPANRATTYYASFIDVDATKTSRSLSEPFPGAAGGTVRVVMGNATSSVNNDRLLWVTPKEIFDRLRKRSDIATALDTNINTLINNVQAKLTNNLASYAEGASYTLPAVAFTSGTATANYYDNFSDQFRYRKCATANSYCFGVNGAYCDGVLLFGGLNLDASNTVAPRATTSRNASDYLESTSTGGLPFLTAANPTGGAPQTGTGLTQSFASTTPTQDIVQCLTPQVPVQVSNTQMFAVTNTALSGASLISASGTTLTLGSASAPGGSNTPYYGCFWYPTALPFGNGLRAYFEYTTVSRGEGFMFAAVDADPSRNADTNICGAAGDSLGYSGSNGTTTAVNYPKLGVEFDFTRSNPGTVSGLNRSDPSAAPTMHFAVDYWGTSADGTDDVTHGAGNGTTEPTNPSASPGLRQFSSTVANNVTVFVRVDVSRTYSSASLSGAYQTEVYIIRSTAASATLLDSTYFPSGASAITCSPGVPLVQSNLKDMTQNLGTACSSLASSNSTYLRYLSSSATIYDISGLGEAMRRIYLGYTTGRRSSVAQSITIGNFTAATR